MNDTRAHSKTACTHTHVADRIHVHDIYAELSTSMPTIIA